MGARNFILFSSFCEACNSAQEHRAQCSTCADYGSYDGEDRLCNREYRVGDVMDWYPNAEARDTWPGDYSFVSELKGAGHVYVIEGCYGECAFCRSKSRFYFFIQQSADNDVVWQGKLGFKPQVGGSTLIASVVNELEAVSMLGNAIFETILGNIRRAREI